VSPLSREHYIIMVNTNTVAIQTTDVPLPVGSRVTLVEDVDIDSQAGSSGTILFEDYVERYVPETGLLEFEDSGIGLRDFKDLLEDADSIEIITDYEEA